MTHKGYGLEHETELYFLSLTGQTNKDLIISPVTGTINRSFRVPASGALAALKGDVRTAIPWLKQQVLVECKDKRKKSKSGAQFYRLKMDIVQKNIEEAYAAGLIPVFLFAFKGSMRNRKQVVLTRDDMIKFVDMLGEDTVFPDIESIQYKAYKPKLNSKSYTVFKKEIDNDSDKVFAFEHETRHFVLFGWEIFDRLMRGIRACSIPMSEQKKISSDMSS
jgi:hypothetical protein